MKKIGVKTSAQLRDAADQVRTYRDAVTTGTTRTSAPPVIPDLPKASGASVASGNAAAIEEAAKDAAVEEETQPEETNAAEAAVVPSSGGLGTLAKLGLGLGAAYGLWRIFKKKGS